MPLPLLVVLGYIVLGGTAATGVGTGVSGISKFKKAKSRATKATIKHQKAVDLTEAKRSDMHVHALKYSRYLRRVYKNTFEPLRTFLVEIKQKPRAKMILLPEQVSVDVSSLDNFELKVIKPLKDLMGLLGAAGAGASASSGAVGLIALLGSASTGTAIGSLSGAAATNATLAWLGGGSLATSGGGMAAGSVMLGGIAIAPALLIGGLILSSKGEKAITQARKYECKVNIAIETLNSTRTLLTRIMTRINEFDNLIKKLNIQALAHMRKLDAQGFDIQNDDDLRNLQTTLQFATAISEVMRTPILTESGDLTTQSERIQVMYKPLLEGK